MDDNDDDIEIIQANVKVSLRDPIGMLRIVEPVKGIDCRHVDVSKSPKACQLRYSHERAK